MPGRPGASFSAVVAVALGGFAIGLTTLSALTASASAPEGPKLTALSGKIQYRGPTCSGGKQAAPLTGAALELWRRGPSGQREHEKTVRLNGEGRFSTTLPGSGDVFGRIVLKDRNVVVVGKQGIYAIPLGRLPRTSQITIEGSPGAGASNVFAFLHLAAKIGKLIAPSPDALDRVRADWVPSADLEFPEGSHYIDDKIHVDGNGSKRGDEWEAYVLLHEYGHHVLHEIAKPNPPFGGEHEFGHAYPERPGLAWSEGFAHAFAAAAGLGPQLGTDCDVDLDLSTEPVTPPTLFPPKAQYGEASVAAAIWGLVDYLGEGKRLVGMKKLLDAVAQRDQQSDVGTFREVRDALVAAGLAESSAEHRTISQILGSQWIGWGIGVAAWPVDERDQGSLAPDEVALRVSRYDCHVPVGHEQDQIKVTGGDDYVTEWHGYVVPGGMAQTYYDDCFIYGGDGHVNSNGEGDNTGSGVWIPFPYLANEQHLEKMVVTARYVCTNADPLPEDAIPYTCTDDRAFDICVTNGFEGEYHAAAFYMAGSSANCQKVTLPRNGTVEILSFDGQGACMLRNPEIDCSV